MSNSVLSDCGDGWPWYGVFTPSCQTVVTGGRGILTLSCKTVVMGGRGVISYLCPVRLW